MQNTTIKNFIILFIVSIIISLIIVRQVEALYMYTNIQEQVTSKEIIVKDCLSETKRIFSDNWLIASAIMMSEGGNKPNAINYNKDSRQTHDRGCWQINSYWHSEISDACAYDITCSTKKAYLISKGGTDWKEWYGYESVNYYKWLKKLS